MFRYRTAFAGLLLTLLAWSPSEAETYNLQETGVVVPSLSACSNGNAINDNGAVAGESYPSETTILGTVAFSWQHGVITAIPAATPSFGDSSYAQSISSAGIVGGTFYSFIDGFSEPYIYSNGVSTIYTQPDAGNRDPQVNGINKNGVAVGQYGPIAGTPFTLTNGVYGTLPLLAGDDSGVAYAINGANPPEIVGYTGVLGSGVYHAVLWKNGVAYKLGALGGASSIAYAINDNGVIVGEADLPAGADGTSAHHAFMWTPAAANGTTGTMKDLGIIATGVNSSARGVNNAGVVVGDADVLDVVLESTGFVWTAAGGMKNMFPLIVAENSTAESGLGYSIVHLNGINNSGQVVGTAKWGEAAIGLYDYRGIVLSPTGGVAPAAPLNLQAINPVAGALQSIPGAGSSNTVNLTWQGGSINETGFLVQRQNVATGQWLNIATTGALVQAFTDNTVAPNTSYAYRLFAKNTYGTSAASNVANVTTGTTSVNLIAVAYSPSTVKAGTAANAKMALSAAAPVGGANINLSFDGAALGVYQIAAGATSSIYAQPTTTLLAGTHTLSALYNGVTKTASLIITKDAALPTVASLTYSPASVAPNGKSTGTITLSAAPAADTGVTIMEGGASIGVITVPAGKISTTYTYTAGGTPGTYTDSAVYNATQASATLTVTGDGAAAALSAISVDPASVVGGTNAIGTVTLTSAAPAGGASVTVSSSLAAATVTSPVTIPAGATSATFTVKTTPQTSDQAATLTATYLGVSKTTTLTVKAPGIASLSFSPASVNATAGSTGTIKLSGAAPAGGAAVAISIDNVLNITVTVPAGSSSGTYTQSTANLTAGAHTVVGAYNGTSAQAALTVLTNATLPTPATLTFAPNPVAVETASMGTVTLSAVAPTGGADVYLSENGVAIGVLNVPAGSKTATYNITNANPGTYTNYAVYNGKQISASLTVTASIPDPVITTISPTYCLPGAAAFTLVVNGTGFVTGDTVLWKGVALTTTFASATKLTAVVPAASVAAAGTAAITVKSPTAQVSNAVTFTIAAPPTITSLSPATAVAGGAAFTLTVNGTGFVSGDAVLWKGVALTTTFVSATKLTAAVPAANIAAAGSAAVTVKAPTTQTSAAATFTITAPVAAPAITTISPTYCVPGAAAFTLTVNGTGFVTGDVVLWKGVALTTTFGSATKLVAAIPAANVAAAGTAAITVKSPTAQVSNVATFTMAAVPTITRLSPASTVAGSGDFTVTVNGIGFVAGDTVLWKGIALTTTFGSATKLTAAVPAANVAAAGSAAVTVKAPTTQTSAAATFTITAPVAAPAITTISPTYCVPGAAAFTLTVNGIGFIAGDTVLWKGVALTTTFGSATKLTAAVPAANVTTAGTAAITVKSPTAQVSNAVTFTIAPAPAITSISPSTTVAGSAAFTLTVNGTGFVSGAAVLWNGTALTTTFVSAAKLTVAVPAANVAVAGTASITVKNPTGQVSTAATETITAATTKVVPSTLTMNPNPAFSSGETVATLTLTGAAPAGGAVVPITFNGTAYTSVTVPAGQTNANFAVAFGTVTVVSTYTLGATYNGTTITATGTVNPTTVKIKAFVFSPVAVVGGDSAVGTVTLTAAAPAGGAYITISGAVNYSFLVPSGKTSASYTQPTATVTSVLIYSFTAAYNGSTASTNLTVTP